MIGRKQFGRISIANSDAGASAYTNAAIDQAYRAVQEQLKSSLKTRSVILSGVSPLACESVHEVVGPLPLNDAGARKRPRIKFEIFP